MARLLAREGGGEDGAKAPPPAQRPPASRRAMHLLVAVFPILLGTARYFAPKSSYPVASFPSFCVSAKARADWRKGRPAKNHSITVLRETRLLAARPGDASSPTTLRFLARGHFHQVADSGNQLNRPPFRLGCDEGLKGRVDRLLDDLYSKPRRFASSDGGWDGDPGTITHLQFLVSRVKLDGQSLRAGLDTAKKVEQIVQVSVPRRTVASDATKARGAASAISPKRAPFLRAVADAPEWARACPPPEWDTKWLLCALDDSGKMGEVPQMWPPPQWHPCAKGPCDLACPSRAVANASARK
ncbi:hypothetical protein EMIHUDRAFT_452901 [Emiliania huxleyi CCMP1516]|uniref:Uncharacterized protein n=2 Tax=Emiliania huxleyi TaxID=2903 RepID=A0A0D3IDH0_EMIH1|nr:hypothetical protein EMIHUDRAFT_452901 [Emiliania huxleyi CCMP1516]EOD09305.1 hypothetical protein EMIHUDRAFT_452901 [Emiliania huxleyi CCMP1516]|eukprot:XP_005761734.1 hypothetical protein EMIHUDRAFT_452901 [Emiliania huxleyi CCMP1516]